MPASDVDKRLDTYAIALRYSTPGSYLAAAARNEAIDVRSARVQRSAKQVSLTKAEDQKPEGKDLIDEEEKPYEMDADLKHAFCESADKLAKRERQVVEMYFWACLSTPEIAIDFNISIGATTMALSRGLNTLRSLFR